jgi:hypothetical protein
VAGLCAALAAGPARAQINSPATILGGPSPSSLVFQPIDTSSAIKSAPGLQAMQNRFNFNSIFNKFTLPSFPLVSGTSALPSPSSYPKYPDFKYVGKPPYQLGDPKAARNAFQPIVPIIPSTKTPVGPGSN